MKLAQIQDQIQKAIISGDHVDILKARNQLTHPERFSAHLDAYPSFTTEYITNMFPRLFRVIGEDLEVLCEEYATFCPPQHYDLSDLVNRFVGFLKTHSIAKQYPFLLEIAEFEGKENTVYHLAKPVKIDLLPTVKKISADPKRCYLKLQKHVRWLQVLYKLGDFFQEDARLQSLEDAEIYRDARIMLLYQKNWHAHHLQLFPLEFKCLEILCQNSFAEACLLCEGLGEESVDLTELLLLLLQEEIVELAEH